MVGLLPTRGLGAGAGALLAVGGMGASVASGVPPIPTPPPLASTFRLSYGPAGQPEGTIVGNHGGYALQGTETLYTIDASSGSPLELGYIEILDSETGYKVTTGTHVGIRLSNGVERIGGDADSAVIDLTDNVLTATYTDTISGTERTRTHTFTVEGNAVRVLVEATGSNLQDYNSNYTGFHGGVFDNAAGFTVLECPGMLATPTVYVDVGGSPRYFAHMMDLTQSHSSDFNLTDPKTATPQTHSYSTTGDYAENTAGQLQRGLREVIYATVSNELASCFVHPSEGSTQIARMAQNPWTFLTSSESTGGTSDGSWDTFSAYLDEREAWGMTRGTLYPQFWWQELNYPLAANQINGQHWYPAGEASDFAAFGAKARALGFDFGVYTLWGIQNSTVPNYDEDLRVVNTDGSPRLSDFGGTTWLGTEESVEAYMDLYLPDIRDEYSINMVMYDVETYASPVKGSGNHMDNATGSPSGTLRDVIAVRRAAFKHGRDLVANDAYTFGEGGLTNHTSEMEFLWAGAVDGIHQWTNCNGNAAPADQTDPLRSVSAWYTTPEHEWTVRNQYFANTGDLPARFFTQDEIDALQVGGSTSLAPYSRAMNDRMRAYSILLGRAGSIHTPGADVENFLSYSEQLKEYYITNSLTAPMRDGSVPTITYHDDTYGYETFNERLSRLGMDGFRLPRVRMVFGTGYTAYVNRGSADWVLPDLFGTDVTLPEDGFLCFGTVQGEFRLGGSCSTPGTAGLRVDFAILPNRTMIADGRRSLTQFMGMLLPGGKTVYQDCENNFRLTEQGDGTILREAGTGSCTTPGAQASGFGRYESAAGLPKSQVAAGGFHAELAGGRVGTLIAGGN